MSATMRQVLVAGPNEVTVVDSAVPEPGPDEVRISVMLAGNTTDGIPNPEQHALLTLTSFANDRPSDHSMLAVDDLFDWPLGKCAQLWQQHTSEQNAPAPLPTPKNSPELA